MDGTMIGGWRGNAERHIIIMGDAPGHDPEPWPGGYSYADVLNAWAAETNKISIDTLLTGSYGYSTDAEVQFSGLSAGTGGIVRSTADGNAGEVITEMVSTLTETPREPNGETSSFKPVFTFIPPTDSMGPTVKNILLEIQKWDTKKSVWKKYMLLKLAADANSWTPTKPLPQGSYQWRTGYIRGAGTFMLPSGETRKVAAATLREVTWTAFTRVEIVAATPTPYEPTTYYGSFTAFDGEVIYSFSIVTGADKYGLAVSAYDETKGTWKLWKKLVITPTAEDVNAAVVDVTVKGHKVDGTYTWSVQSLNYDHPKPVWPDWSIP
jgi:hypothetical protein